MKSEKSTAKHGLAKQLPFLLFEFLIGAFVSTSLLLHTKISFTGDPGSSWPANFIAPLGLLDIAPVIVGGFAICFALELFHIALVNRKSLQVNTYDPPSALVGGADSCENTYSIYIKKHVIGIIVTVLPILVCWMLVWFNYLPGTSMNDQLAVIGGPIQFANNHPLLYNLLLSGFVRLGRLFCGSGFFGFAAYILCQMVFCAFVVALCCTWLRFRGASRRVCIAVVLFFALAPIMSNYAMSAVKDTFFAYVMVLWVPYLGEMCFQGKRFWSKRRHFYILIMLVAGTALTRNNGLYIAIAMSIIVILVSSGFRKHVSLALVIALAISLLPNVFLAYRGVPQLFRESVGIPLQQLAAVVCERESSLTKEELGYLNELLPIETMRESYAPMSVDLLKYNLAFDSDYLQETKGQFLKTWIAVGIRNLDIYLRAFFSQTYGVWDLFAWSPSQSVFFSISDNIRQDSDIAAMEEWELENRSIYPENVSRLIDSSLRNVSVFLSGGSCFLLILLGGFACAIKNDSMRWILPIVPSVFLWGTLLIATPLATAFRYTFPLAVAFPFVMALATVRHAGWLTIKNKTKLSPA